MIAVDGVSVELGGRKILDNVTMSVGEGRFAALMGPNGSGKTTLLRAIYGALSTASGSIRIDGHDTATLDRRVRAQRLAVLRQEPRLDFDFRVDEVVMMGRSPHKGLLDADGADDRAVVDEVLAQTDTVGLRHRIFTTLSGGEKQRVLLARALAQRPSILLLDEPTNHLDVKHQLELLSCVRNLGVTVLAALHDVNVALRFSDDVVLLVDGKVHAAGAITSTLTDTTASEVFGVAAHRVQGPHGHPLIVFGASVV